MQMTRVPQSSRTTNHQNRRRTGARSGLRSEMLILYLLILAVVATGLTAALGRNWHDDWTRGPVPQMSNRDGIKPASPNERRAMPGEGDEPLSAPGEEKHDSIGDDVIVRIER